MNRFLVLILFSTVTLVSSAQAQLVTERMRINTQNGEEVIGLLKESDASSVTILLPVTAEHFLTGPTERNIPYADIFSLERSLGSRRHTGKGALAGLGIAVLAGVAARADENERHPEDGWGGVIGVLVGGGIALFTVPIGAGIGALVKTEKWEIIPIPNQGAASVTPVIGVHPGGRLALGARISF